MAKQKIKILLVGGGSGGHILPVVPIAQRLVKQMPHSELRFWCDYKMLEKAEDLFKDQPVKVSGLSSGKFRRYHHLTWWQNLQPGILGPNLVDLVRIGGGFIQSFARMIVWRPDVVFAKGGFVCLPVGFVARLLRIKLVIHDSDTVPGLTNRILGKIANKIATGYPTIYYNYPKDKSVFTGIPVRKSLIEADKVDQKQLRQELDLPVDEPIVLVTGGGLGAQNINQAVAEKYKKFNGFTILVTGEKSYQETIDFMGGEDKIDQQKIKVIGFANNMDQLILASDVVVSRAGATIIAELATAKKPTILIPNPKLTGGHQLKNAQIIGEADAALVLDDQQVTESNGESLNQAINQLTSNEGRGEAEQLAMKLYRFAKPDAVAQLADLILCQVDVDKIEKITKAAK